MLRRCYGDMKKTKREKWIRDNGGQLTLTSGQIAWTVECTKALYAMSDGHKMAMRQAKKKQSSALTKLCDMVRGNLGKLDRKKVVNILTIEVLCYAMLCYCYAMLRYATLRYTLRYATLRYSMLCYALRC